MLFNYVGFNFFIERIFKRMRFFLFLFLSLFIESNITERDDVKEFIEFAISNSNLEFKLARAEALPLQIESDRRARPAPVLAN